MLKYISMWDNEHGRVEISPQKAKELFPNGLSSECECFLCEVCSQYVAFVVGSYNPHFKHTNGSKYCEQKSTSFSNYLKTNPRGFSLPLKININDKDIEILIGFLPLDDTVLMRYGQSKAKLIINNEKQQQLREFNINSSRFFSNRITYLSVGSDIAKKYIITYPSINNDLKNYWPTVIDGVNNEGTIFNCENGKRIPYNANVVVNNDYWLLTYKYTSLASSKDIDIVAIKTFNNHKLYKVKATKMSIDADKFFRKYNCRLTDNPVIITPLFPFVIKFSHIITHMSSKVWFHKTNGNVEIYPQYIKQSNENEIFSIQSEFKQLLSVSQFSGYTSELRYLLLRKINILKHSEKSTSLIVKNINGEIILEGVYNKLPIKQTIEIITEYDGHLEIIRDEFIINKKILKNGQSFSINVDYNYKYIIYQGLDKVYELDYIKAKNANIVNDETLLYELQKYKNIPVNITHSFGGICNALNSYPKTNLWLRKQILNGKIAKQAKLKLQKIFEVN